MPLIATLIANPTAQILDANLVKQVCAAIGVSDTQWLAPNIACDIKLAQDDPRTCVDVYAGIKQSLAYAPIDIAVQPIIGRRKRALIADMDSTMIEQECIDELAQYAGVKDQVSQITARAMNGEIDFEMSLRQRVELLRGLATNVIEDVIRDQITFTPGGKQLVATMKAHKSWCALVSGGFTAFTQIIAPHLGFDENHANTLLQHDAKLTGKVAEPILGMKAKVEALNDIAATKGITSKDFIAVGDGANDLGMLRAAGTGVALHAKPAVADKADIRIDHADLTALLYIQGYKQSEFAL